jgi:hypothetical protein
MINVPAIIEVRRPRRSAKAPVGISTTITTAL